VVRRIATEHSTFEFMSEHKSHFDERLCRIHRNGPCGLAPEAGEGGGKVRVGRVGGGKQGGLSVEIQDAILARWKEVIGSSTGLMTYQDMRDANRAELQDKEKLSK
jgi:hypothetical protein